MNRISLTKAIVAPVLVALTIVPMLFTSGCDLSGLDAPEDTTETTGKTPEKTPSELGLDSRLIGNWISTAHNGVGGRPKSSIRLSADGTCAFDDTPGSSTGVDGGTASNFVKTRCTWKVGSSSGWLYVDPSSTERSKDGVTWKDDLMTPDVSWGYTVVDNDYIVFNSVKGITQSPIQYQREGITPHPVKPLVGTWQETTFFGTSLKENRLFTFNADGTYEAEADFEGFGTIRLKENGTWETVGNTLKITTLESSRSEDAGKTWSEQYCESSAQVFRIEGARLELDGDMSSLGMNLPRYFGLWL
ncbi:MAG: hypothetical protein IPN71_04525 [Fibrobacteres bacterium]|nr:hypothetical protein [Fibrobacterota bacterium]